MAVEGPNYPPHPPLARPGWWRDRPIWIGLAGVILALIVLSILARSLHGSTGAGAGAADAGASAGPPAASSAGPGG